MNANLSLHNLVVTQLINILRIIFILSKFITQKEKLANPFRFSFFSALNAMFSIRSHQEIPPPTMRAREFAE